LTAAGWQAKDKSIQYFSLISRCQPRLFNAIFPDTITEAGLVGQLPKESAESNLIQAVKRKVLISLEKHHSKGIVVHGHEECAGNPVNDEIHLQDTLKTSFLKATGSGSNA